jgi:hypothetical protein
MMMYWSLRGSEVGSPMLSVEEVVEGVGSNRLPEKHDKVHVGLQIEQGRQLGNISLVVEPLTVKLPALAVIRPLKGILILSMTNSVMQAEKLE